MKDKGNTMWWVVGICAFFLLVAIFIGWKSYPKITDYFIKKNLALIEEKYKKEIKVRDKQIQTLMGDVEKSEMKYQSLVRKIREKAQYKPSIPKDEQEIRERFIKLGYPPNGEKR